MKTFQYAPPPKHLSKSSLKRYWLMHKKWVTEVTQRFSPESTDQVRLFESNNCEDRGVDGCKTVYDARV